VSGDFAVKINEVIAESLYDTLAKVGQASRRAAWVRPDATGTSPAAQYAAQLRAQAASQKVAQQAQRPAQPAPTAPADQFLSQFQVNPQSKTVTRGKDTFARDAGDNWVNALNGRKVPANIAQYLDMVSPLPTGFSQFPNQPIPKVRQPQAPAVLKPNPARARE